MLGRKRFDQNEFLRMIELLLEFVAINLGDHCSLSRRAAAFLDILGMQSRSKEMSELTEEIARCL